MKLRKYKEKIIGGIQFFLMISSMVFGFWFEYLLIWLKCGLPMEWWAFPVTLAIALLSVFGLCQWIMRS